MTSVKEASPAPLDTLSSGGRARVGPIHRADRIDRQISQRRGCHSLNEPKDVITTDAIMSKLAEPSLDKNAAREDSPHILDSP